LKYLDPNSGQWAVTVYKVITTNATFPLAYNGVAGAELLLPEPLKKPPLGTYIPGSWRISLMRCWAAASCPSSSNRWTSSFGAPLFAFITSPLILFAAIVEEENDKSLAHLRELARNRGITIHVGSLAIKLNHDKAVNRSFLIDPKGEIVARYDKIHMFDVDLANGESYRESYSYRPGELGVLYDLPWGRLGLTICYDLRFPALYRALAEAGATALAIPAAFTRQTGEAHWHVLNRARAIENGSFVFAAAQGGKHENGRETFGHSLIIDPWGRILAEGGTEPGVVMAEIDLGEVAKARAHIPSLQHGRRFEIAEPMAEPTHLHMVRRTE
jgi:predicted amidohydrolase